MPPQKIIWPQNKPHLLSSVPYPPSQPEMACWVWNLDPGRELGRAWKEAVGKLGTTFLSSPWPWPQVPHLPDDSVPLRHIPHQGWSMEATWKLKSSVLSLLPGLPLTVWSWTKPSSSLGSPWKWVFSAIEFCYLSSCWGKARSPHFFAIKPTFSASLYSRTSLPWLAGTSNN